MGSCGTASIKRKQDQRKSEMGIYAKAKDFEELRAVVNGRGAFVQDPRNGSWSWKRRKGWRKRASVWLAHLRKPIRWSDAECEAWWDVLYDLVQESEDDWDFDFLSEWMGEVSP